MNQENAILTIINQRSRSLTGVVRAELERMILAGELKAGERLNEQALATKLGVSRGPIREARRSLEGDGLLVEIAHKGVYVRELLRGDLLENYDVRALLTGLICAQVALGATKTQKKNLWQQVDGMDKAIENNDSDKYYELNIIFHDLLSEYSDHKLAQDTYESLAKQSTRRRQLVLSPAESNQEHKRIMEAIEAKAAAEARKLGEDHVMNGKHRWMAKHGAGAVLEKVK